MTIVDYFGSTTQKAPSLAGYTIDPLRAIETRDEGKLLTMRLETSRVCDLRCIYCNNEAGMLQSDELTFPVMQRILREGKSLGVESVVLIGGGEPLLYPFIKELITFIDNADMTPVIITNGMNLTDALCSFLRDHNASILLKCDSFNGPVQDYLAGEPGTHAAILRAIEVLRATYGHDRESMNLRIGLSFVVTSVNHADILHLWKYCRENNFYPNYEEFIPRGRGLTNRDRLYLDNESVHALKKQLLAFDRKQYGYDWILHSPLPGHGCLQPLCSVYITSTGTVRPCPDIAVPYSNVKTTSLEEIITTPFFRLARTVDKHLQGKCGSCEYNPFCIGCRGNAFSEGVNRNLSPEEALYNPDPLCLK